MSLAFACTQGRDPKEDSTDSSNPSIGTESDDGLNGEDIFDTPIIDF